MLRKITSQRAAELGLGIDSLAAAATSENPQFLQSNVRVPKALSRTQQLVSVVLNDGAVEARRVDSSNILSDNRTELALHDRLPTMDVDVPVTERLQQFDVSTTEELSSSTVEDVHLQTQILSGHELMNISQSSDIDLRGKVSLPE